MLEVAAGIVEPVGGLGDPAQYRLGVDQAPGVADGREQADSLVGCDQAAVAAVLAGARSSDAPALLVAAALISGDSDGLLLARATTHATTTRDRQLVAVAAADLDGDHDLFDALIRDHLADHPDNVLAAWIATRHTQRHIPFTH
jgi:hypothetical protein